MTLLGAMILVGLKVFDMELCVIKKTVCFGDCPGRNIITDRQLALIA